MAQVSNTSAMPDILSQLPRRLLPGTQNIPLTAPNPNPKTLTQLHILYNNTAKDSRLQAFGELRPLLYLATYYSSLKSFNSSVNGPLPGATNPGILFQFSIIIYIITIRLGIRQWD